VGAKMKAFRVQVWMVKCLCKGSAILEEILPDWQVWSRAYCKFMWYQPSSARPGVEASSLGYFSDSGEFIENRGVPIRDWTENLRRTSPQPHGPRGGGRPRRR
jgi:hypothetical protein